jgi:UDP-N-acetylmuramyl pentapeptide phosphotransferase/UDP-N-acetylglucosamine-1-phosphate transferase
MLPIPILNVIASFLTAAFITWLAIPRIVRIARQRKLTDRPGQRKIHKKEVPTLGGIGIFSGFFVALMLFVNGHIEHITIIAAASMIIFLMGTKDDLVNMTPLKKLFIETIVAFLIAVTSGIRLTHFHGFLGIDTVPVWISIVITVFIIILIMNSFNLIDGIDGLATSVGILISLVYAVWFWMAKAVGFSIMAMAIAGALSAFLPFNLYNGRFKIFMGDTGSLTIGLLLAILTIKFNELNVLPDTPFRLHSAPAIAIGILFLPLFDTMRVTFIRISQGSHPFHGDNNHLHHRLLRLGLSHIKATFVLIILNAAIIALSFYLDKLGILALSLVLLGSALLFSNITFFLERKSMQKNTATFGEKGYYLEQSILKNSRFAARLKAS